MSNQHIDQACVKYDMAPGLEKMGTHGTVETSPTSGLY